MEIRLCWVAASAADHKSKRPFQLEKTVSLNIYADNVFTSLSSDMKTEWVGSNLNPLRAKHSCYHLVMFVGVAISLVGGLRTRYAQTN